MNKNSKLRFINKLKEKSPKFAAMLKKKKEQLRKKSRGGSGGPGLSDNLSLDTSDNVKFELIKDKEVWNFEQ